MILTIRAHCFRHGGDGGISVNVVAAESMDAAEAADAVEDTDVAAEAVGAAEPLAVCCVAGSAVC